MFAVAAWGCGESKSSMAMPMPTAIASPLDATVVAIVGQQGMQSFQPNPAPVRQSALVLWHNEDVSTHHIVMNDGSYDSGEIAPGGWSSMMRLAPNASGYHCTIHPTLMFGALVASD